MNNKQFTLNGVSYLLMDSMILNRKTGDKLISKIKRYKCIALSIKTIKKSIFGTSYIVLEILVPEQYVMAFSNEGLEDD